MIKRLVRAWKEFVVDVGFSLCCYGKPDGLSLQYHKPTTALWFNPDKELPSEFIIE